MQNTCCPVPQVFALAVTKYRVLSPKMCSVTLFFLLETTNERVALELRLLKNWFIKFKNYLK